MDLFDGAIFDSAIFDTGAAVSLHGGTKQKRRGGRRDLDAIEQARERERLAHLKAVQDYAEKKAKEAAQEAVQAPVEATEPKTILALIQPELDAENERFQQAQALQAEQTARAAADAAQAYALAVQRQLDDEAAQAFMAYLMAA